MSLDKSKQENDIKNCRTYNCYESFMGKFCRTVGSSVLSPVQWKNINTVLKPMIKKK